MTHRHRATSAMRPANVLTRIGFILLAGCSFDASCNAGKLLNMDKAQSFVSDTIESYTSVKPTKVSCPDKVKLEKGGNVVCSFEVAGLPGTFTMQQTDSQGTVSVLSVTGIIASSKLEASIEAKLEPKDAALKVDCGARVHPSKPGDVLTCDVRRAQTVVAHASVTIKDEANNVEIKIVPTSDTPPGEPSP
ncbi:MAG TPA: DUF4333 domain-containing protein [Kofleriaceae bacterium]